MTRGSKLHITGVVLGGIAYLLHGTENAGTTAAFEKEIKCVMLARKPKAEPIEEEEA